MTEVRLVVLVFWIAKYSRIRIRAGAATPVISQSCDLLAVGGDVYVLRIKTRSLGWRVLVVGSFLMFPRFRYLEEAGEGAG